MAHVILDPTTNKVTGWFRWPQTGWANYTELPDNDPRVIEYRNPPPPPPSVTQLQFRRAVRAAGAVTAFMNAFNTLSDDMKEMWQFATVIARDADFVLALQQAGGWTDAQVDNFFAKAATFPAI